MAISGDEARELSRHLIDTYFRTVNYPYTRHHIDSFDQFLQQDLVSIVKSQNPILILKDLIDEKTNTYKYKVEIFVGGEDGTSIEIGTPTISLQNAEEVRVLFPNEARLRNLTYASQVYADIIVKITYTTATRQVIDLSPPPETFQKWPLFKIPIMLQSRYCILNNKPKEFLREAGECPYDNGGYFIVDGAEKVLITRQEQAFNTLYVTPQTDPKVAVYASISCLSAETRQVKRIAFALMRHVEIRKLKTQFTSHATIQVSLPFVRKSIPLFVLFRALGFQSDEEILKMIFPDFDSPEAKLLLPKLQPSIIEAFPFLNTYTAVQYIKTLTKGFSIAHVLDIIKNQLFIHMPNDPSSQALFLADCVRKILRVSEGYDNKTDRDDTRNQRCLTSGFLVQELFNNSYKLWVKASALAIDKEYNYNKQVLYKDENFKNIFQAGNDSKIFLSGLLSDMIAKGFKGKWGTGLGEEKTGVLQAMSRLSYVDFMSHCRRVILDFDTGMKLTGPRKLHPSQYGYLCTSETPTGASIGITKNLSIMTAISTASKTTKFFQWLRTTGRVYKSEDVTEQQRITFVPVYVNGGMFGFTAKPYLLTGVLKALKRSGCLPYSVSISFSIRDRTVYIYMDAGRPLRPLIWLDKATVPVQKLRSYPTWRDLVMGNLEVRRSANLESTDFVDPLEGKTNKLEDYPDALAPNTGAIEYVDPYEQNEAYIANNPAYIKPETTHIEVHPSTIMSMMTSLIPFAPHNQSPRNQLSCSQSKQGLSIYATNWRNRFDNTAHVLCYGEMPLTRTIYNNYLGEGKMAYGMNIILAIACWSGYNQEDGIVMNYDAIRRGMFRSMAFRSYEAYEEDDERANTKVRIGNPALIGNWKDLKPGLDYSKLDDRGIVREGEYVDENTVIVGAYMMTAESGNISDASKTPQVWTRGRVEKVVVMVNNMGLRLVKIRVVQDRMPELGDKFCLTEDHEVLTTNGWKSIALVTKDDKVCTLSDNDTITYTEPTELYKFNCIGDELYNLKSQQVDLLTTLNHKMYIKKRNSDNYCLEEAKNIIGKRVQYKKNATNKNTDFQLTLDSIEHHSANNVILNMDLFLEFLGYWISDGWVYEIKHTNKESEYRIEVCLCKDEDRERFTLLCKDLGYNPYSSSDNTKIYITNKQLAKYLNDYSNGAINKRLPDWVWQLSEHQCRILIKGLIAGDGTVTKNGVERFFTSSNILADQFQRLCLHAGWSANKSRVYEAGTKFTIKGKNTQANADFWALTINKHKNNPMVNHGHSKTQKGQSEEIINFTGNVYCIQVPSHIFYVRRNGKPVWTGNSNRHGQKGTIGAMLRGHDMPRTESGIVPDMIMNPHAIPSRMTIAQNLEQLLGKTAALSGAIGDGTSFMNDGSPQEAIGSILEEHGYEKYGNEVLYNGATGEQINAAIFIGPVYGMRLKHMVEDKWNARGKGKKEVRTHQPTGGRGAQGGLKIGEMDRDAIIAHGGMSFVKESFMERSDGAKFPLCVACGTIPIYNPKLNIAICPLCDGPVKYIGDTVNNLEILPPLGRPKSKIVEVEMPYSTKLLTQEQETYLNLSMRYITTSGVERLKQLEFSGTSSEVIKELPRLILPETVVPAYIEEVPKATLTVEQLRSMGAQVAEMSEQERAALDTILEETDQGMNLEQQSQMNALSQLQNTVASQNDMAQPQNQVIMPGEQQMGGMPPPSFPNMVAPNDGVVTGAQVPGSGPVIAIDTSTDAMMRDGIMPEFGTRQVRRNRSYGGSMAPMMPSVSRYTPMEGGNPMPPSGSNVPITITKLE
jgi:DNA-directed RNA polymerase beta subunit